MGEKQCNGCLRFWVYLGDEVGGNTVSFGCLRLILSECMVKMVSTTQINGLTRLGMLGEASQVDEY